MNQIQLELNGRTITLLGTAHISHESIDEVTTAVDRIRPDCVAVELDEQRYESLNNPDAWRELDIVKVLKKKQGFLLMANLVLAGFQRRMGVNVGVQPGDEMKAAAEVAKKRGISMALVDRPIQTTLRRAWAGNSFWGKCKLLSVLITSAFSKEEITDTDIENLKKRNEMDSMMNELSSYLPGVKQVLIDERDRYLASHVWQAQGTSILAVLGAGHLPGVERHLELLASGEESVDTTDISSVPPKKNSARIIGWAIPLLIVLLIAAGFYFGGRAKGAGMVGTWFLWNSILAAVGTIIAGGHPLTIAVGFVSAPFTSLCPVIGVGMFTGLVQAVVRKPKVSDMEMIQNDITSIKGFYNNRILRVLLVFFLSSLGSAVGTFVAGATIVGTSGSFFSKIIMSIKSLF